MEWHVFLLDEGAAPNPSLSPATSLRTYVFYIHASDRLIVVRVYGRTDTIRVIIF